MTIQEKAIAKLKELKEKGHAEGCQCHFCPILRKLASKEGR